MINLKTIKEYFNHWALIGRSERMAAGHQHAGDELFKYISDYKKSFSFLDIGCGNGWAVRKAVDINACTYAYGIDVSLEMIKVANYNKKSEKEYYLFGDFDAWKYEGHFDVIFSIEALYYFKNTKKILRKVYSLLKDNGMFVLGIDFYKENKECLNWPNMLGIDMQLYSEHEWEKMLKDIGFNDVYVQRIYNKHSNEEWKKNFGTLAIIAKK